MGLHGPLCDNPQKISSSMRIVRDLAIGLWGAVLAGVLAWPQAQPPALAKPPVPASVPLVLAGGTIVDVTEWGHSARDLQDAVVIVRDGRISEMGPRSA